MSPMHLRRIVPALLLAACTWAADAPTDAQWAPVARAIEAGAADAVAQAEAITTSYPKWPDGHRALAAAKLRAGDAKGAWASARAALGLRKTDAEAAALGIQALAQLGRHPDALKVAATFDDSTDTGGQVAAQAALVAQQSGDAENLAKFLSAAKARAGSTPNPLLDFIAAKQALAKKDIGNAIVSLERAVAGRANWRDALYELGRVRTVSALQSPAQAIELLAKAEDVFTTAARLDTKDAAVRFALGRARLELGKRMITAGQADDGAAKLRMALTALDEALALVPNDVNGQLWKGDALLRLERYEEAVPLLRAAWQQGVLERALPFNLSMALSKSGKSDEAMKVLANLEPASPAERLTLAMNAYRLKDYARAWKLLDDAKSALSPDDPKQGLQRNAVLRYIAHCQRELAMQSPEGDAERERLLDEAAGIYRALGDIGDFASRHWFMAVQSARTPLLAFDAGKQSVKWDGLANPTAMKLLVANYGYKVTKGQGIGGAFSNGLPHVFLWSLLAVIPLGLFLKGLFMPSKPASKGTKPIARPAGSPRPAGKPPTSTVGNPATKRPAPPTSRRAGAPPARKPPVGGPKTPFGG